MNGTYVFTEVHLDSMSVNTNLEYLREILLEKSADINCLIQERYVSKDIKKSRRKFRGPRDTGKVTVATGTELTLEQDIFKALKENFCTGSKGARGDKDRFYYLQGSNRNAEFIFFGGLCIEASDGMIVFGLNPNSESYIVVASLTDMINAILFKDTSVGLSWEDIKYWIEETKLGDRNFDFLSYAQGIISKGFDSEIHSVVLTCAHQLSKSRTLMSCGSEEDFLSEWLSFAVLLKHKLQDIGNVLFNNYFVEEDMKQVYQRISAKDYEPNIMARYNIGKADSSSSTNARLTYLLSTGVPSEFFYAALSYGFGVNRISALYREYRELSNKGVKNLDILQNYASQMSSLSCLDNFNVSPADIGSSLVEDKKCLCYNIFNLLRGISWEQDLFFGLEIYKSFGNESLLRKILDRFELNDVLSTANIKFEEFVDFLEQYKVHFSSLYDCGSMYSRKVSFSRYHFVCFSIPELFNSGRVFNRMSQRLLKGFK